MLQFNANYMFFTLMVKFLSLNSIYINLIRKNLYKLFLALILVACTDNNNQNITTINLAIRNHCFTPEEIILEKNTRVNLIITNYDNIAEEFECLAIHREKLIPANSTVKLSIPPLKEGIYEFIGEFNPNSAKGRFKVE